MTPQICLKYLRLKILSQRTTMILRGFLFSKIYRIWSQSIFNIIAEISIV